MASAYESWTGTARTGRSPTSSRTTGKIPPARSRACSTFTKSTKARSTSRGEPCSTRFEGGKRVYLTVDEKRYETTLGQLYFWWWASRYDVLKSLSEQERITSVEQHMAQQHALSRERKRLSGKRKRSPLSKAPSGMDCVVHEVNCTHRFEDSDFEDD